MRVLVCLAEHAGEVVSSDDLLNAAWSGVSVSQDSVYQAVASLRRLLGDDPRQPTYIETVPRLGYRLVATVSPWVEAPARRKTGIMGWIAAAAVCLVGGFRCGPEGPPLLLRDRSTARTHPQDPIGAVPVVGGDEEVAAPEGGDGAEPAEGLEDRRRDR